MEFGFFTIALLVIAGVLVLSGLRLLIATGWFMQFLRGFAGFGQILLAALIVLVGLNLASYSHINVDQDLANISFKKLNEQQYEATIVGIKGGVENKFVVDGDMWQVSSRTLKVLGSSTKFYQLESISGRYYSLEQQRTSSLSMFILPDNSTGLDLWGIFKGKSIGIFAGSEVKSKFYPMSDGAVFSVSIGSQSLEASPVNAEATKIVNEWK